MAELTDAGVSELLAKPNHAVLSTINKDGSVHNTVVWLNVEDGKLAVNGALGRKWPTNIARDPRVNLVVINQEKYPWRAEGEVRQKFQVSPERIRYAKA